MTGPVTTEALVASLREANERFAKAEIALQQVTAERDEARAKIERLSFADETGAVWRPVPGWTYFGVCRQISTAKAELDRLRAEGEAKDRALKEIAEHPENYDDGQRSYAVGWAFWNIQNIARTALARAATAREGA